MPCNFCLLCCDNNVAKKLRWAYSGLARVRYQLPEKSKLLLYHALWRSHLIYGLAHYGAMSKSQMNMLQTIQNKSLRCVFNLKYTAPVQNVMYKHHLLTVEDEIILSRIMLAASCLQDDTPDNIRRLVKIKVAGRSTRMADKTELILPDFKKELHRKSSSYQVPYQYNQLRKDIQDSSYSSLKHQVKELLLSAYKS